eukprot:ANDGO_02323.mRNA.1 hypothetical protein
MGCGASKNRESDDRPLEEVTPESSHSRQNDGQQSSTASRASPPSRPAVIEYEDDHGGEGPDAKRASAKKSGSFSSDNSNSDNHGHRNNVNNNSNIANSHNRTNSSSSQKLSSSPAAAASSFHGAQQSSTYVGSPANGRGVTAAASSSSSSFASQPNSEFGTSDPNDNDRNSSEFDSSSSSAFTSSTRKVRRPFVFDNSKFREAQTMQQQKPNPAAPARRLGSLNNFNNTGATVLADEDESIIQEILNDS